jgi:hypothetical protein
MSRKVIFIVASALVFFVVDFNWVYPTLFNTLNQIFSWGIGSTLAGCQISTLVAEWYYLDRKLIGIL